MRNRLFILSLLSLIFTTSLSCAADENTRHPYVDGSFYPKDPAKLSGMIDSFLAKAPSREAGEGEITAILVPHAGYVYSGQVAAYAFKKIEGLSFDTVILFGLYHKAPFEGASVWTKGSWKTPLGEVPIDTELAEAIVRENKQFAFTQDAHRAEHSLEVEIPFLQKTLKNFKIVPIVMNTPSLEISQALAEAIVKNSGKRRILILGSTDMSHYHAGDTARTMDLESVRVLELGDTEELLRQVNSGKIELCGIAGIAAAIETAKRMGGSTIRTLRYAHSGNVTGDDTRVVGYGSLVIYKGPTQSAGTLSSSDQRVLLKLARDTLESYVTKRTVPGIEAPSEILKDQRAVFVTLRKGGDLRGCIGQLTAQG
ncbi:MAG TPA: AmmeMemoRadiSam system protein B, partial [Candidatus Omnitrophota bacterium]|nr:AmmeMemoRadiSam system protein B [Candidatus Omnitrophota bacterium]